MRLKRFSFFLLLIMLIFSNSIFTQSYSWPESAVYDAAGGRYLISNNGSGDIISVPRTNPNNLSYFCLGTTTGYAAMRGLAIVGNTIWGACTKNDPPTYSQVLVGFDMTTGAVTHAIIINEGAFINDITYDYDSGLIYLSDNNNIYRVNPANDTYSLYLLNAQANGLLYIGGSRMLFTDDSPQTGSYISSLNLNNGVVTHLITNPNISSLDGLTVDNLGNYYVSYWATTGQNLNGHGIFKYDSDFNTSNPLVYFNEAYPGYADVFYDQTNNVLVVPKMSKNEVDFVQPNNLVGTKGEEESIPSEFRLHQNFPNPFNPTTSISYDVVEQSLVNITIFDLLGREVVSLINQIEQPGVKTVDWDGRDSNGNKVDAGVYVYKFSTGNFTETKKMVLLK